MKFKVHQRILSEALSKASRIAGQKTTLAVLANTLFDLKKDQLKIAATNLEEGLVLYIDVVGEKDGQTTLPAKVLEEFVSSLETKDVVVETREGLVWVIQGKFQASFNPISAEEFPAIPSTPEGKKIGLESTQFVNAAQKVCFAASSEEGRPVLTGVLFEVKDESLQIIATDGYRLSFNSLPIKKGWPQEKIIIPSRAIAEVLRITSEGEQKEDLALFFGSNQVIFQTQKTQLIARLIDGEFPAWEKIVPAQQPTQATICKEDFLKAVKIASIFARDSGGVVKLSLKKDKISLSANTKEVGSQQGEIEAKISGPGGEIAFNYRYLLDILAVIEGEEFVFTMNEPLNPGVFRQVDKSEFFHLIMPVRIQT